MGFGTPGMTIKDPDLVSSKAVRESQCIEIDHYYVTVKTLFGVWTSQISIWRDNWTLSIASGADHLPVYVT